MLNTVSWKHLAEQMQALEALKSEGALKKEIEFETKLRELLDQYGFGLKHIINLLDQQTTARQKSEASIGKSQRLKEWKAKHGAAEVENGLKN